MIGETQTYIVKYKETSKRKREVGHFEVGHSKLYPLNVLSQFPTPSPIDPHHVLHLPFIVHPHLQPFMSSISHSFFIISMRSLPARPHSLDTSLNFVPTSFPAPSFYLCMSFLFPCPLSDSNSGTNIKTWQLAELPCDTHDCGEKSPANGDARL